MIHAHCGTRLTYTGRVKGARPAHTWVCTVCKRRFKQHIRVSKPKG